MLSNALSEHRISLDGRRRIPYVAVLAFGLALGIFFVHSFVSNRFAVGVLYVVVVVMSVSFCSRRGVLAVAAFCMALTVISFIISDGPNYSEDYIARCIVSLFAISVATVLAVRMQSVTVALRSQAELLDLTHETIFVRAMDDIITYWNRGAEELYGWPREKVIGQVSHHLMQTRFPAPRERILAELLLNGRWEGELVHINRDGAEVTVASRWSLQRDARGAPTAILETDTDITAAKQAQDTLAKAQAKLAHVTRVATLGELTASIAHEVNQPLAGIVTNGEACLRWLGRDEPQYGEVRAAVTRMISDGRRASEVIKRLRALAKNGEPQQVTLNLNDVISESLALMHREIISHRVALEVDLAPDLPVVRGDRVQLQQVIINLLVNAFQAMASVAEARRALCIVSRLLTSREVVVTIRDSGPGIAAIDEARLFTAFFSTKSDGMGMGLSICRSIIDAHGGHISASANNGPGATFQFILPMHGSEAA
ncbi:sensor histidine kinase [Methylovirgula sp. HY1]|uniref:sensor histidine kinase n=1 Tax=Methylovirgula sp. HY1 TaxID=2822761 RepID=UPI001C5ADAE4|nr:ATP-binding protein [Methylovirgula sp. HY1]QXX73769.1 Sensor histidine kinase TmoS [Methylovirgula sp. HY1]